MKRVLITGSSNGLGVRAARLLLEQGHAVTLHGRNEERADRARAAVPEAEEVLVGDFESVEEVLTLAGRANERGTYDAVIHNAGVGYRDPQRVQTVDGLERTFAVNVLAPFLLSSRLRRPCRLVFLSSGLHHGGEPAVLDPQWQARPGTGCRPTPTASSSTLSVSEDDAARTSGRYFFHQVARAAHPAASSTELQDELLAYCAELTGVPLQT